MLRLHDLTVRFDGLAALDRFSLRLERGSITALIGPNGSGKTTCLNAVSGLLKPASGKIEYLGRDVTRASAADRYRLGIARTFQADRVFRSMSVRENVCIGTRDDRSESAFRALIPGLFQHSQIITPKVLGMLEEIELHSELERPAGLESFGRRRLLEILRALAGNATLFMLDEPFAGVFPDLQAKLIEWVKREREDGRTFLVVDHNTGCLAELADRIVVLDRGQTIADGDPESTLRAPQVLAAYFGEGNG